MTTGSSPDLDIGTLELINNELTGRAVRQAEAGKGIDTKAGILATFTAAAAQFLATRNTQPVLAAFAYVGYAVAFGFAVWSLAVTEFEDVPKPRALADEYAREPKETVLRPLIAERVGAIESNQAKYEAKAGRWRYSLAALALGLVLSVLAMVVQTDGRAREPEQQQSTPARSGTSTVSGTPTPTISRSPTHSPAS